jgi:hypothetical protein
MRLRTVKTAIHVESDGRCYHDSVRRMVSGRLILTDANLLREKNTVEWLTNNTIEWLTDKCG